MIDENFVINSSKVSGLKIDEGRIKSVTAQLQRIAEIAQKLDEVPLDPFADEIAPVWRP